MGWPGNAGLMLAGLNPCPVADVQVEIIALQAAPVFFGRGGFALVIHVVQADGIEGEPAVCLAAVPGRGAIRANRCWSAASWASFQRWRAKPSPTGCRQRRNMAALMP